VQNRSPNIEGTRADLGWSPAVGLRDALTRILESYRHHVAEARSLVE
jgi:nucleoside-diphosphate-sugar epimerase